VFNQSARRTRLLGVAQLDKAADLAGGDAIVRDDITTYLTEWMKSLGNSNPDIRIPVSTPDGWFQVYKSGSVVCVLHNGNFVEREIVESRLADPFGSGTNVL
jgi:DEAD/DEAH box helicase domain-containing protein